MAFSPFNARLHAYRTAMIASMWACILIPGCREKRDQPKDATTEIDSKIATATTASAPLPPPPEAPPASDHESVIDESSPELDLGTPAPVVISNATMVARTKQDGLLISKLKDGQFQPLTTPVDQVSPWPVALASGSSLHAYWVSNGQLMQREIKPDGTEGDLVVVAKDASPTSPVAAARSSGHTERDVVLYLGSKVSKEGERSARLWVEGHGSRPMSREAGGATSLSLVHLGATRFALLTLDGRLGMSPVHAVSLELDAEGAPHLGEDRVVYVAGTSVRRTAITGVLVGRGPIALLPISKGAQEFGMLVLRIGYGNEETPSAWVDYPNGLDPAPLATATICEQPTVAFVRPEAFHPDSQHVLELARLGPKAELEDRRIMATASVMPHVALWGDSKGGWLVYPTERGLGGRRFGCD